MERNYNIELVSNNKVKIIDVLNLSPWNYSVLLNNKWYNLYIDSNILEFPRDISSYFLTIDDLNKNRESKIYPTVKICLDLIELKKLEKIDQLKPGQSIIPVMPNSSIDVEKLEKLEKELNQKQKQLIMLSSKLDNLENLLKKSLGL